MTGEDNEIKNIVEKILRKLLEKKELEETGGKKKKITEKDEHGIYVYSGGEWKLLRREGEAFRVGELGDGVYVVYFDNTRCPACRLHDVSWFPFVEKHAGEAFFVIVLCEWFARRCESPAASKTFLQYRVKASPTTLFARVKKGNIEVEERKEGYMSLSELEEVYEKVRGEQE